MLPSPTLHRCFQETQTYTITSRPGINLWGKVWGSPTPPAPNPPPSSLWTSCTSVSREPKDILLDTWQGQLHGVEMEPTLHHAVNIGSVQDARSFPLGKGSRCNRRPSPRRQCRRTASTPTPPPPWSWRPHRRGWRREWRRQQERRGQSQEASKSFAHSDSPQYLPFSPMILRPRAPYRSCSEKESRQPSFNLAEVKLGDFLTNLNTQELGAYLTDPVTLCWNLCRHVDASDTKAAWMNVWRQMSEIKNIKF